jgi:hypothetical protein
MPLACCLQDLEVRAEAGARITSGLRQPIAASLRFPAKQAGSARMRVGSASVNPSKIDRTDAEPYHHLVEATSLLLDPREHRPLHEVTPLADRAC